MISEQHAYVFMPEGQGEPCDSCKWVDVIRASLKQQVKLYCTCLKTGQATGCRSLSHTEFRISPLTTDRYNFNLVFHVRKSTHTPYTPFFFHFTNTFFPEFKDPSWNCYFYHTAVPLGNFSSHYQRHKFALQLQSGPCPHVPPILSIQSCFCDCHAQIRCYQQIVFLCTVSMHKPWNKRLVVIWKSWEPDSDVHLVSEP